MLLLLLPPFLFSLQPAIQSAPDERSPVVVINFRWFRDRQAAENAVAPPIGPQPAMNAANKNAERQRRINASPADRDPNLDSLDGRSAALDKIVQDARAVEPIDGFSYQLRFQNDSAKVMRTIFWEYQFKETANPANVSKRHFVCLVKLKPSSVGDTHVFSTLGPSNVIDVKHLSKGSGKQFDEAVVVDRVEYSDGTIWERKDWNYDEVKLTAKAGSNRSVPCRSF